MKLILIILILSLLTGCIVSNNTDPTSPSPVPDSTGAEKEVISASEEVNCIYVSNKGNDDSGNGTLNNPYKTISYALTLAEPGDTVVLGEGIYEERVRIRKPDITIKSKEGEKAVIKIPMTDEEMDIAVMFDVDSSGSKLEGLEITGGYYYGIFLQTTWDWGEPERYGASNIIINNCKIHDTGRDCIKITPCCDDVLISNCEIYNSGKGPANIEAENAEGIDNVNGDRMIVRDCHIHDIATTGIYFKGGATGCLIERTLVENCGEGGIMAGFDTSPEYFDLSINPDYYESIDGTIKNCIVSTTEYAGIGLYASKNTKILNNTIINTAKKGHSAIYFGISYQDWEPVGKRPPSINPIIMNNIAVSDNTLSVAVRYSEDLEGLSGLSGMPNMDYNLYYNSSGNAIFSDTRPDSILEEGNLSQWKQHIYGDKNSFEENPLLNSSGHLMEDSPAVGRGFTIEEVTDDYDRELRSPPYDTGADEI